VRVGGFHYAAVSSSHVSSRSPEQQIINGVTAEVSGESGTQVPGESGESYEEDKPRFSSSLLCPDVKNRKRRPSSSSCPRPSLWRNKRK